MKEDKIKIIEEKVEKDYDNRNLFQKCFDCVTFRNKKFGRIIHLNQTYSFSKNIVRNQKYSLLSFLPKTLYEQFKFFFNFYFLIITLTQFIPILQVGIFSF
jgi:hypothetical protein